MAYSPPGGTLRSLGSTRWGPLSFSGLRGEMLSSSIIICFLPYRNMLILENRENKDCLITEMNRVGQLIHFLTLLFFLLLFMLLSSS